MKLIRIFVLFGAFTSFLVGANTDLRPVFPDPVSSSFGADLYLRGDIEFKGGDDQLNFDHIDDSYTFWLWNVVTKACNNQRCYANGERSQTLNVPEFQYANGNSQLTVDDDNDTLITNDDYNNVTVMNKGELLLGPSGSNKTVVINNLMLSDKATLILQDGIYFIENLTTENSDIELENESTTVTLLIKNLVVNDTDINTKKKSNAGNLGMVLYNSARIEGKTHIDGFIYALDTISILDEFTLNGAINAANFVLEDKIKIEYNEDDIVNSKLFDFNVEPPKLIGHWPLDICPTQMTDSIPDIVGEHHAIAKVGLSTENAGKYCQSGRLQGTGAHIYIPDNAKLRGEKGTISFWFNIDDLDYSNTEEDGGQYLFSRDSYNRDMGGHISSWVDDKGRVRLRYQTNSNDYELKSDKDEIQADQWYFYAVTWDNDTTRLYINGNKVDEDDKASGSQKNNSEPMIFGGNASRSSNSETTPSELSDFLQGNIDDIRWYNDALNNDELSELMAQTGYECTACDNVSSRGLVAEYRFSDTSWGDPGDIQDSSGNAMHATLSGETRLLTPVNNMSCGTLDIPPNTDQNTPDFLDTPIDLERDVGPEGTISFWFKSNSGWQDDRDRTLLDAVQISQATTKDVLNKYFYLMLKENGSLQFGFESSNDADIRYNSNSFSYPESTWVHIALNYSYNTKNVQLFLNGIQQVFTTTEGANWNYIMPDYGHLAFADNRTDYVTATSSANGRYDDVRVYSHLQNAADIQADMQKAEPCAVLYGYKIEHPDQALTCDAAPVTVKACKNQDCSELYEHPVQISLAPSPNGDPAGQVYEFQGQFKFDLVSRTPGNTPLVFTPMYHAKPEGLVNTCTNGCNINFVNAGLQIYADQATDYGSDASLPQQITAQGMVAGASMSHINMRAVRDNNGVCEALVTGTKEVNLTYACYQYDQSGNPVQGCAVPFGALPLNTQAGYVTRATNMLFNNAAQTDFGNFSLPDATHFTLKAQLNVDGAILQSNQLNVEFTPQKITLSHNITNNHIAGLPFNFSIVGYGANDILLPSYNPQQLTVYASRIAPETGTEFGSLSFAEEYQVSTNPELNLVIPSTPLYGSQLRFTQGQYLYENAYFSDVGTIELYMVDQHAYRTVQSNTLRIGPFVPAYFDVQAVYTPEFEDATSDAFTYVGQPFFFDISALPKIEVTAYNALNQVAHNYTGELWKLFPSAAQTQAQISYTDVSGAGLTVNQATTPTSPTVSDYDNSDGSGQILLNNIALQYAKPTLPVSTFSTGIDMVLDEAFLTDVNGTCYQVAYPAGCSAFTFSHITGTQQRYGRLNMINAFGPEDQTLSIALQAQYYAAGNWLVNIDDNSTNISLAQILGQISLTPLPDSENNIASLYSNIQSAGFLAAGISDSSDLSFPPANLRGGLQVTISSLVGSPAWAKYLNYDWNGDGMINGLDAPSATINFGMYRGNDRKINYREVLE